MGTNYYFMTKNKSLVEEFFPFEYELVDTPYFGYEIHLNKLSCGWLPLLQRHEKAFTTFKQLEDFYYENSDDLEIFDEYGEQFTFKQYKDGLIQHSKRERIPMKWDYFVHELDKYFEEQHGRTAKKSLHTVECSAEEAELYIPFRHNIYQDTEKKARYKFHVYDYIHTAKYFEDPDYEFDWTEGEFS